MRDEPSILVANSMGGMVISEAAARRPDRVKRLVYVAAFLPGDGQSLVDLTSLPEGADDLVQQTVVVQGDPPVGTLPSSTCRASNADCSPEVIDWAVSRTGSQPFAPLTQPVSLNPEFDRIPRTYVLCTADRIVPPGLQRRMIRDRELADVVELDSGHHPQLSRIDELAAPPASACKERGAGVSLRRAAPRVRALRGPAADRGDRRPVRERVAGLLRHSGS